MIKHKNTFIKNIYYMLSYAFKVLKHTQYEKIESETFDNIYDLFAEILIKGISKQLKQGLYREYILVSSPLSTVRGKINLKETIQNKIERKNSIHCDYDELSIDNLLNQVLKVSLMMLMKQASVKIEKKVRIKKLLLYFSDVSNINPKNIPWGNIVFHRNNQTYEMLLNLCKFLLDNLLLTTSQGENKMPMFSDENIDLLFERFVLEYYKRHYPELSVEAPWIDWKIRDAEMATGNSFLPKMKTDIVITNDRQTLIIDTKFYKNLMTKFNSFHSNNLYQIFAYVNNFDSRFPEKVEGMLLYAKTDGSDSMNYSYNFEGHRIHIRTLSLDEEFKEISRQLDEIVEAIFY